MRRERRDEERERKGEDLIKEMGEEKINWREKKSGEDSN